MIIYLKMLRNQLKRRNNTKISQAQRKLPLLQTENQCNDPISQALKDRLRLSPNSKLTLKLFLVRDCNSISPDQYLLRGSPPTFTWQPLTKPSPSPNQPPNQPHQLNQSPQLQRLNHLLTAWNRLKPPQNPNKSPIPTWVTSRTSSLTNNGSKMS